MRSILVNIKMHLTKSIFKRMLIISTGLLLISLVLIGSAFFLISYRYVVNEKRKTLDSTAEVIANAAAAVTAEADLGSWQLSITLSSTSQATGTHVSVCNINGIVVATSDKNFFSERIGFVLPGDIVSKLYKEGSWSGLTNLGGFYGEKRWVSATTIKSPYSRSNKVLGYVFTSAEREDIGNIWRSYACIFLIAACIVVVVVIPVSIIISKRQSAPLCEMADAARSFAKGNLSVRVKKADTHDEIGELADAFNQMADSLEKSEQNRREFVSNISHELKTPMTTIAGYAEGMLDGTIPMKDAEKYLAIIADETHRLSRLVRRMLDISRMKEEKLSEGSFDLIETLTHALLSLEAKINDRKLDVDLQLPEFNGIEKLNVKGDMDSISQVIYNILDNAVKFARQETMLRIRVWKQESKAYVSITDRGETIPSDDLPLIFDRFHKSDRSRSLDRDGVGLGLYIVKSIIDRMGEDIWVRSRDGETEFVFSLTLQDG